MVAVDLEQILEQEAYMANYALAFAAAFVALAVEVLALDSVVELHYTETESLTLVEELN
jgi:hypothetical protein